MKLQLRAKVVEEGAGLVTLDVRDLNPERLCLSKVVLVNPKSGEERELTNGEERDLEDALEMFRMASLGRALSKLTTVIED